MFDLVACKREAEALRGRLQQARGAVDGVCARRRVDELRARREAELLESEMELDARQAASADAARVMREMQGQLLAFIEAEERLCADAEGEMRRDVNDSRAQLAAACDETVDALAPEKTFYVEHAPPLHELGASLLKQQADAFLAGAQQDSLRLLRIASDGMAESLKACEVHRALIGPPAALLRHHHQLC